MNSCTHLFDYKNKNMVCVKECTCCGSNNYFSIYDKDRYGYDVRSNLCMSCGVVFISPRMSEESYMEFYNKSYRQLVSCFNKRKIDKITIQNEQEVYANSVYEFIKPHIVNKFDKINLLDVGGSTGIVSKALKDEFTNNYDGIDVDATVIDPSMDELAIAKENGLNIKNGFIENLEGIDEKYNLIILCQTIDHLFDIRKSLTIIYHALTNDGIFFIDIVDFKYMLINRGIEKSIKLDHPHNFSYQSTFNILQDVGFSILATSVIYDGHLVGFLCSKQKPSTPNYDLTNEINDLLNLIRYRK